MLEQEEESLRKFEEITGVSRKDVFQWDGIIVKETPCPKWLEEYIQYINLGAKFLGKKPFKFNSGQFQTIGKLVKEISTERNIPKEDTLKLLILSVAWKAKTAKESKKGKDTQYYTKDFFCRKKNNLKLNLWHYENWVNDRPYTCKDFTKLLQGKKVAEEGKKDSVRRVKSKSISNPTQVPNKIKSMF